MKKKSSSGCERAPSGQKMHVVQAKDENGFIQTAHNLNEKMNFWRETSMSSGTSESSSVQCGDVVEIIHMWACHCLKQFHVKMNWVFSRMERKSNSFLFISSCFFTEWKFGQTQLSMKWEKKRGRKSFSMSHAPTTESKRVFWFLSFNK